MIRIRQATPIRVVIQRNGVVYILMVDAWRLLVMLFPQNEWRQATAPYTWSLIRNTFLTVQKLGVMIALSYTFYATAIQEQADA